MDLSQPPMPLGAVVEYLSRNEWQLKLLGPMDPVKINASVLRACLVYLRYVKDKIDESKAAESAEGREYPELPSPDTGERPPGYPASDGSQG